MKITSIIIISLFIFSCSKNNLRLVKTYEDLHNSHDIDGMMSLYHDSIIFELVGIWVKSGKEEIRELEEWDSALNSNLKFQTFEIKGDSVFFKVIEKNDWFKAVGIEKIIHNPTVFIIEKGSIKKIIAYPSEEIGKEIGAKIGSIYSWSNKTGDSTIFELIKDEEFIYSEDTAKKWLELLNRWKASDSLK